MYDIIIIGGGPAGLTACIYASIARKNVLLLEKNVCGGQILKTDKVKNYPGFEEISGYDYSMKLLNQAESYNPDIKYEEAIEIKNYDDYKEVVTRKDSYKGKVVIIATGAENRKLSLENEENLVGKGISYCATCDGAFYKDKEVAIFGGGNNAIDDALYLSNIVKKLYVIYRQKDFKIDSINLQKLKEKDNVEFILDTVITKVNGNDSLESIIIKNNSTNEEKKLTLNGLFVSIGHIPVSNICKDIIDTTDNGYIIANEDCYTNIDGILTAGDIRKKDIRQLTTACADGTTSALNACKLLNKKTQN